MVGAMYKIAVDHLNLLKLMVGSMYKIGVDHLNLLKLMVGSMYKITTCILDLLQKLIAAQCPPTPHAGAAALAQGVVVDTKLPHWSP